MTIFLKILARMVGHAIKILILFIMLGIILIPGILTAEFGYPFWLVYFIPVILYWGTCAADEIDRGHNWWK